MGLHDNLDRGQGGKAPDGVKGQFLRSSHLAGVSQDLQGLEHKVSRKACIFCVSLRALSQGS